MGDTQITPAPVTPLRALVGPGSELGAYRLLSLLGTGGMGQVFLAEHIKLGRKVALKLLLPEFAGNAEVIGRFFHEARAVNQINHAHIVEIIDFVEERDGANYFIMELLAGHDLATTREKQGPFAIERIVRVTRQICSALTATHAKGIVHRDLKPENIFLVEREEQHDFVKLLDFGIAKLQTPASAALPLETTPRPKTRNGTILGTPEFMSPEQAGGQPIDGRSDLYALGVILYWMLADQLPFRGDSLGEVLIQQLTAGPPPLGPVAASGEVIPEALRAAVERCLERDPQVRLQSAQDLLDVLAPIELGSLPAPQRRRPWTVVALVLGLVLLAAAAVGAISYGRQNATGLPATAPPQAAAAEPPAPPMPLPALPALPSPLAAPETVPRAAKATSKSAVSAATPALAKPPHPHKKKPKRDDDVSGMIDPFAD